MQQIYEDPPPSDKENLFKYLWWNSCRSEQYKIFYVATPKVACTSLKWWFANLEGYSDLIRETTNSIETDPDLVIHDSFQKVAPNVSGLLPNTLSEIISSDSYFKFAIVRNPYKRIFSAWQSKLLLQVPHQTGPYLQCDFFNREIESVDDIASAFEGFLEHISATEAPSFLDIHWTLQKNLLRPDLINYTKIFKIENAKEVCLALRARLGEDIPDPFANRHANESIIPYLPEFITDRSSELIRTLYSEDFEFFNYSFAPPKVKEVFSDGQLQVAIKAIKIIRGRHQRLGELYGQTIKLKSHVVELQDIIRAKDETITSEINNSNMLTAEINDLELELHQIKDSRIFKLLNIWVKEPFSLKKFIRLLCLLGGGFIPRKYKKNSNI